MSMWKQRWRDWWRRFLRIAQGSSWNALVAEVDRAHQLIIDCIARLDEESVRRRSAEAQLEDLGREVRRVVTIIKRDADAAMTVNQTRVLQAYAYSLERALPSSCSSRTRTRAADPAES